jgi:hypothetical protein
MKIKIPFICCVCCFVLQANAQTEFAPIGAEWYYTYEMGYNSKNYFNHVISEKDTVVDGNSCRILRQYYEDTNIVNKKYIIKQEQGKVYYYYQNQFHLWFDFDAKVNDTIEFAVIYRKYDSDSTSLTIDTTYTDTIISTRYRVASITTNAQNLKMFRTEIIDEDKSVIDHMHFYIEKIGLYSLTGSPLHRELIPIYDNLPHLAAEFLRWIRCYSDADISFVSDEWVAMSLPCNHPITSPSLAVDIPKDENIKIYPNPIHNKLKIENGELQIKQVELYSIIGNLLRSIHAQSEEIEIDVQNLQNGIYFVKITKKDNSIKTFKIVKL